MTKLLKIMCVLGLMATSMLQSMDVFYHISHGNYTQVEQWIKSGLHDHSVVDLRGNTIVHAAVLTEDVDMLNIVLSAWVNLKAVNNAGQSALDLADKLGNKAIIKALVDKKASMAKIKNREQIKKMCKNDDERAGRILGTLCGAIILALLIIATPVAAIEAAYPYGIARYHTKYYVNPWYDSYDWWTPRYHRYYVANPVYYY